jgi:hypothetical protein
MVVTINSTIIYDLKFCSLVESEILAAVTVKSTLFWGVMPCGVVVHQCFRGKYCPYFQGQGINKVISVELRKKTLFTQY